MNSMDTIARRRGFKRIVHFHVDHFEPHVWLKQHGLDAPMFQAYLLSMAPAKLSAFFCPVFAAVLRDDAETPILDESADDEVVFSQLSFGDEMMRAFRVAAQCGVDPHIHVHHELWTNTGWEESNYPPGTRERRLYEWVRSDSAPEDDSRRFERAVKLYLRTIENAAGASIDNWAFVHGCWALAGSDRRICTLQDEIPRLHKLGCRADFSFPAGRRSCDPKLQSPLSIEVIPGVRVYDDPAAMPIAVSTLQPNLDYRFLVWNHGRDDWWSSLDYHADHVRTNLTQANLLAFLGSDAPVIRETCYIKTHAHSCHPMYLGKSLAPLAWARDYLEHLRTLANNAGVDWDYLTVREALSEIAPK